MNIILQIIPYGALSVLLSSINRDIRAIKLKIKAIEPGTYAEAQLHYYESYLTDRISLRNNIMKEVYRRAERVRIIQRPDAIALKGSHTGHENL